MLIAKGYKVGFKRSNGQALRMPTSSALLHDPTGKSWSKCSGLVAGFRRERLEIDDKSAYDYFNYDPNGGKIQLPPKSLSQWKSRGHVSYIQYTRPGDKEGPGFENARYEHTFAEPVRVYQRGSLWRLELGPDCVWNWRGIVKP